MPLNLYSKDSVDNLLAEKLDLAGGTLTGGLTLSASGIIFSDSTYLTTAPSGSALAADQLTAGVVTANPTSGPTTAGDVLQYDGTDLIWAAGGGGGVAWGAITGTVTDQTDLVTYVTGLGYQTATDVSTYVTGLGYITGVSWGDITGTLSSQTDLNTVLNQKALEAQAIASSYGSAIRWDGTNVRLYVGTDYIYNNFITNGQTFGWLISSTITAISSISSPTTDSAGNYYVVLNSSGSPDTGSALYYSTDSGTTWSNSYTPIK